MGIWTKRLPEYGVTVVVWSGRLTLEEVRRHVSTLEVVCSGRWLNYYDPSVDLSGLDIEQILQLNRVLAAKLREIYGDNPVISAVVSAPETHELLPRFWPHYVGADRSYPAEVVGFTTVEAACDWLNLADDGRRAVIDAVESSHAA
jgi:hypothetical protein